MPTSFSPRTDANAMRLPSGVHTGALLCELEVVSRASVPRAQSSTQTSHCLPSHLSMAIRRPSGANLRLLQSEGADRNTELFPERSNHTIGLSALPDPPGAYTSAPEFDTANSPAPPVVFVRTLSATGNGGPVTSRRSGSNAAAKSVPLCR